MNATQLLIEKGAQVLIEQCQSLQAENERLRELLATKEPVTDDAE